MPNLGELERSGQDLQLHEITPHPDGSPHPAHDPIGDTTWQLDPHTPLGIKFVPRGEDKDSEQESLDSDLSY